MNSRLLPTNETARLADLRALGVLDTPPEPEFDGLTHLAAQIAGAPIARVTFVDSDRQWSKSSIGLDGTDPTRDGSFCGYVVASGAPMVVPDAVADPRFLENRLVAGPHGIRFYAGFPIQTTPGRTLGTLCVMDHRRRTLAPTAMQALAQLADLTSALLVSRRTANECAADRAALAVYRSYFELTPEFLFTLDAELRFERVNPAWATATGHPAEALHGRCLTMLLDERDAERLQQALLLLDDDSRGPVQLEVRCRRGDGRWATLSLTAVRAPEGFYFNGRDVTRRRAEQRSLAEREARLRALFDALGDGVIVRDESGRLLDCNAAAFELWGLSRNQLVGADPIPDGWSVTTEDGRPCPVAEQPTSVALRTGHPVENATLCVRAPNGHRTWLVVNARPIDLPGEVAPRAAVAVFRDVTLERRAREIALRVSQQERLLTTGTLAAGVGHEINNPLSYIIGNLELLLEEMNHLTPTALSDSVTHCRTLLLEAREGAERVRRIVRGLRALAQEGHPAAPTDVRHVVAQSLATVAHVLRPRARVDQTAIDVPAVLGDEPGLTQVLVNLLMNAAQAFTADDPARNRIAVGARLEGARVIIEISDNGVGIPAEVLPRIYDPFFTTRPVGQGLGLGLSISHSIVSQLDGTLSCNTEVGRGTSFTVSLRVAPPAPSRGSRHLKRVLLVDDDPALLASLEFMLEADHHVVATSNPVEALRLVTTTHFDVVIADLSMPHLNGRELFESIRQRVPNLADRFVLISGSHRLLEAARAAPADGPSSPVTLEKPIHAATMRAVLERLTRDLQLGQTDVGSNGSAAWSRSR